MAWRTHHRLWIFVRRARLASLLAVLWCCAAGTAASAERLRIGTSGDYRPFTTWSVDGGQREGLDITIAEAFASDEGYTVEWIPFSWPELATRFEAGHFDLVMSGITVRAERSVAGRFSVPVVSSGAVLLYRQSVFPDVGPGTRLQDFDRPGVRIAVNRGGHLERVARAHFDAASIDAIASNALVREALADERADAVVTDSLEMTHWLAGLDGVSSFGPWTRDDKAYWMPADGASLAVKLDSWLLAREADGTLARRRREAGALDAEQATATPLAALLAAIVERLALMPWVAASKMKAGRAIEDTARESRVIESGWQAVHSAARRAGIDAPPRAAIERFYRAQIEAAKAVQIRAAPGDAHPRAEADDLAHRLRPALIRIGERMAGLLVRIPSSDLPPDFTVTLSARLRPFHLDEAMQAELADSIAALAGSRD